MASQEEEDTPFPLHAAARDGRDLAVRSLIRANPSLVSQRDEDDRTPLFWAVSAANAPIVQLLLTESSSAGSLDIDAVDEAGWTTLHIAASVGSLEIVDLLVHYGASLNVTTSAGQTPLHYAVSRERVDVVRRLVELYPAATRVRDKRGQIPLHRAAAIGSIPLIRLLVRDAKGPLNVADRDGWTPLFHASAEGRGDAALELIRCDADTSVVDREGKTFLDVCVDDKVGRWIVDVAKREGLSL
ncbi:ankyrin repeat-containing domain protein [Kockiozyma suomiensis]|uniref:ankyrin repeat-containing domain protein n=1 Tax=Kockiozyma suomiensis TaxID=1337062 RepID=UPI003343717D